MEVEPAVDDTIHVRGRNFHCSLCDIKITSEKSVQDHMKGKKHQKLLDLTKCRQAQAEHSVFVGGLHKLMSELVLADHFMQFGSVSKVIVDKDKSKYALVEFSDKESVLRAAEKEKQTLMGCKITVRPREHKPFAVHSKRPKGGSGDGKSTSPQSQQYGTVPAELQKAIVLRLAPIENVSDQMKELVSLLELPSSALKLRYLICTLLQEVFKEFFPACSVYPFGSSVNGYGVLGCDLDLHLEPDGGEFTYKFAEMPKETSIEEEEMIEDKTDEDTDFKEDMEIDLDTASSKDIMELVCKVLRQCVPSCQNIRAILHARRPVVKFQHKASKLYCDISMNNRLTMRNTELLHFYASQDERVRPLVYTVRHWAKARKVAGNPRAGPRLTNYALSLMVVYYLQTRNPSILPTVEQLQEGQDAELIEGWNCSFCKDAKTVTNTESLADLLCGFFHFYSTLDFTTSVLRLRTGSAVHISTFTPPESPIHKGQLFRLGPINIQDPFELSHNVALNVNEKVVQNLRKEIKKTYTLCLCNRFKKKQAAALVYSEGDVWGLPVLFEVANYENTAVKGRSGSTSTEGSQRGDDNSTFSIVVNMKASQLSETFVKTHDNSESLRMAWRDATAALIKHILCDVLKFRYEERISDKGQGANNDSTASRIASEKGECKSLDGDGEEEDKSETGIKMSQSSSQIDNNCLSEPDKKEVGTDEQAVVSTRRKHALHEGEDVEEGDAGPAKRPKLTGDNDDGTHDDSIGQTLIHSDESFAEAGAEENTHLVYSTYHQVWIGRRKIRRHLNHPELQQVTPSPDKPTQVTPSPDKPTPSSREDWETLVTNRIISESMSTDDATTQPLTTFKVIFKHPRDTGQCSVKAVFQPLEGLDQFKALFQFLQTFLVKIIDTNQF